MAQPPKAFSHEKLIKPTAHELFEAQVARDLEHHRRRVTWLSADSPRWADGTPLKRSERKMLLDQSLEVLANPAIGYNTGPQE